MEGIYDSAVISSALAFYSAAVPCILYQGTWGDTASLLFVAAWLSCWYSHRNPTCISTSVSGAFLFWPRQVLALFTSFSKDALNGPIPQAQLVFPQFFSALSSTPLEYLRTSFASLPQDCSLFVKQITRPSLQTTEVKNSVLFQLLFP